MSDGTSKPRRRVSLADIARAHGADPSKYESTEPGPRERAIEALFQRRGLAGLFGRPEAVRDVEAIEAAGLCIVDAEEADRG